MGFRELIKQVQVDSGFSDAEAQDALELLVESIAERLTDEERYDFASQLPSELQDIALAVEMPVEEEGRNIIEEFMDKEEIDEAHAKKQVKSAWQALKSIISAGEIEDIQSQLDTQAANLLN